MLEKAIAMIEKQQAAGGGRGHVFLMGEQLKDICRREPGAAALVAQDLENPDMSLAKLKTTFDAFARKNKQGNESCITPDQGEKLIREFYGIPAPEEVQAQPAAQARDKVISFLDFI